MYFKILFLNIEFNPHLVLRIARNEMSVTQIQISIDFTDYL